jgi:hypothetical protein
VAGSVSRGRDRRRSGPSAAGHLGRVPALALRRHRGQPACRRSGAPGCRWNGGGTLASVIKVVAVPPLLGERRWRALLLAAAAIGASVVLFPGTWSSFLHQVGTVQDTINAESGGGLSAWGKPYLFIPTVLSLAFWRCSTGVPPAGWSCRLCFRLRSTTTRCSPFRSTRSSPPSWPFQWPGWPARDHRLHGYPNLPRRVAPLWACAPAWPRGSRPLRRWRIDRRSPPRFPQHRAA